MALTVGTGPFARDAAGEFNFERSGPAHVLYFEDYPRRVRGVFAGETVVDTTRAKLLHETGLLPRWYFPREDVRFDVLRETDHTTHCPFKGDARYWSLVAGDREHENAVWGYPEPIPGAPSIAGHVSFYWEALDHWYEEDEEVFVHVRDPYHRVDVLPTSRHVKVSLDGMLLAETTRALVLYETGLPPRWYIPREDVRFDALEADDDLVTQCPYKGETTGYWNARIGDRVEPAVAWCYADPLRNVEDIAGLVAFFNERVDLEVDGESAPCPETQWSKADWTERQWAKRRAA